MRSRLVSALVNRLGVRSALQDAWRRDVDRARDGVRQTLREELKPLREAIDTLTEENRRAQRRLRLVEATLERNRVEQRALGEFRSMCASGEIDRHVRDALFAAAIVPDPTPHLVVRDLFPPDVYQVFLQAIPPDEVFTDRDPVKQNFKPRQGGLLPDLCYAAWTYLETELVPRTMAPAIARILEGPIHAHYASIFGADLARQMCDVGLESSGARLMLRRPGYFIGPHLDVTRAAVTTLIYFARPGDDERYGTQLFRVHGRTLGPTRSTYYPEEDGATCELAVSVPFRPNSAIVFLNAGAAHGASIPETAPKHTKRYSFQFYVGPTSEALRRAVAQLPPAEQQAWTTVQAQA
jgi:hypothetical protein